jgi:hypothetical protein
MKKTDPSILASLAIGVFITAVLTFMASYCYDNDAVLATRILSWPNTLLQSIVPLNNIGTAEKPFYEGTPINILAFLAHFPLSVAIYSGLTYWIIRKRKSISITISEK